MAAAQSPTSEAGKGQSLTVRRYKPRINGCALNRSAIRPRHRWRLGKTLEFAPGCSLTFKDYNFEVLTRHHKRRRSRDIKSTEKVREILLQCLLP